jgi:predicted exporter
MKHLNLTKWLTSSFSLTTLCLLIWLAFNFQHLGSRIENDLMSLLPKSEREINSEKIISQIAKTGESHLVLIITSSKLDESIKAEELLWEDLKKLGLKRTNSNLDFNKVINFYRPYKSSLITADDVNQINTNSSQFWHDKSLSLAYSFSGMGLDWKDDPFGLLGDWLNSLVKAKVRPYGSSLIIEDSNSTFVAMPLELSNPDTSMDQRNFLATSIIQTIEKTKKKLPSIEIQKAGVLFYASATAIKAENEISTIGIISIITALTLITLAFRSAIAIGAVLLTVCVAGLYAFLICLLIYPKVYLLTLAFGTSLIGMSVDYCLYWLTSSIEDPKRPEDRRRYLLPGMALALLTTVFGYTLLSATPFPVLSQMAIFSISGLIAAWLFVMLFFPLIGWLEFKKNSFYLAFSAIKPGFGIHNPILRSTFTAILLLISLYGVVTFKGTDDIRALASYDKNLIAEQMTVSKILELPSPAQFFIVSGNTPDEILTTSENLINELQKLIKNKQLISYQAISNFVPSIKSQKTNKAIYEKLMGGEALNKVAKTMEMPDSWVAAEQNQNNILTFDEFKKSPLFEKFQGLWFENNGKYFTAILLSGISDQFTIDQLSEMENPSIIWVNKPLEISEIFKRYRILFSIFIALAYVVTFIAISLRFKSNAWRAIAPPVLATFITISILTTLAEPIGLLSVLAFALLLGVGTDYGIFLLQYPRDERVIFSISIGALMSLVAFGTLTISHVPALHSFGITLLFGISLSWALTIFFAKKICH